MNVVYIVTATVISVVYRHSHRDICGISSQPPWYLWYIVTVTVISVVYSHSHR